MLQPYIVHVHVYIVLQSTERHQLVHLRDTQDDIKNKNKEIMKITKKNNNINNK